jgi:hypothetical protein
MLHGVLFPNHPNDPPSYTIALLISPLSSLHRIVIAIVQAFFIAVRARLGVLSVANTSVVWWGQGMGSEAEEEALVESSMGGAISQNPMESSGHGGDAPRRPGMRRVESVLREYRRDHRLLATCESGPPLEVRVPELQTVNWDRLGDGTGETLGTRRGKWAWFKRFGLSRVQEVGQIYAMEMMQRCLVDCSGLDDRSSES